MGRKPNPLIVRYFDRGPKLDDSSNRYVHTCKACHEKFPKGRNEVLIAHITKKCPIITVEERRAAVLEVNGIPDFGNNLSNPDSGGFQMDGGHPSGGVPYNSGDSSTQLQPERPNALMTLATVAQDNHGPDPSSSQPQSNYTGHLTVAEHHTLDNPPVSYEQRVQNNKKPGEQKAFYESNVDPDLQNYGPIQPQNPAFYSDGNMGFQHQSHVYQHIPLPLHSENFPHLPHSRPASPNVAIAKSIAQAAQEAQEVHEAQTTQHNPLDPQLHPNTIHSTHSAGSYNENNIEDQQLGHQLEKYSQAGELSETDQLFVPHEPPYSMNDPNGSNLYQTQDAVDNSQIYQAPHAPMLQAHGYMQPGGGYPQPGGGYPQLPMNSAGSPPIAGSPMTSGATPLTSEFSADPGSSNNTDKKKKKTRNKFQPDRRLEVQKVRKLGACLRCRVLKKPCSQETPCAKCKKVDSARIWTTPCTRLRLSKMCTMYGAGLHTHLSKEKENKVRDQMELQKSPIQIEASHYPGKAISAVFQAVETHAKADRNIDPGLGDKQYTEVRLMIDNNSDDIPSKVRAYTQGMQPEFIAREPSHLMKVTLATASDLLPSVSDTLLAVCMEYWATVHMLVDNELTWSLVENAGLDSTISNAISQDEQMFDVIQAQLHQAVEKRASQLADSALAMLERRLLNASAKRSFELLIAGLIIMNALEKTAWFFDSWQHEDFLPKWPLATKKPIDYSYETREVAKMINMLERTKHVPADPTVNQDGVLTSDRDSDVHEFLEKLQLKEADVINARDNPRFEQRDSRCYELRFCSLLLIPLPE